MERIARTAGRAQRGGSPAAAADVAPVKGKALNEIQTAERLKAWAKTVI